MGRTSAVFIGNGSLLIGCAEAYLEAGHSIQCVVTENADIARWAGGKDIAVADSHPGSPVAIPAASFDYLFSVANLRVLPPSLLSRANKLAINFHDGPLPRYAGLNAPSWALIAQEESYGITWHEMTPALDQGRIVRQALFEVGAADTALSLNTRCYEAGLASFRSIVAELTQGDLALTAQSGAGSYFGRDRRPAHFGTLDFSQPATRIAALVPHDAVYDRSATSHAVNLFDMASKYADVGTTAEIIEKLRPLRKAVAA